MSNNRKNLFNESQEDSIMRSIEQSQRSSNVLKLPIFDSRFLTVNQTGHTTILPSTLSDVNDSGNANWLMPTTATQLDIVSTSAEDGAGTFTGINVIFVDGLDQNLNALQEVVVMNGTTTVTTTGSFRAMNLAIAVAGGIPGSGAVGIITISATTGGQAFGRFLVDNTSCEVGRYTVASGMRFWVEKVVFNGGADSDNTVITEVTILGAFPISLGQFYISQSITAIAGGAFLDAGTTIKFRGFTNSGAPATRKLNLTIVGVQATVSAWDSLKIC